MRTSLASPVVAGALIWILLTGTGTELAGQDCTVSIADSGLTAGPGNVFMLPTVIPGQDSVIIHAAIIFVDFPDDNSDPNNPTWPLVNDTNVLNWQDSLNPVFWSSTHRPPHPKLRSDIVDFDTCCLTGKKWNLTTYFREMSYGELTIVGHVAYQQAPKPSTSYSSRGPLVKDILEALRTRIANGDETDVFSGIDRWRKNGSGQFMLGEDNKADLVVICIRNRKFNYGGVYPLTNSAVTVLDGTPDNVKVVSESGVLVQDLLYYPFISMETVWHEVAHMLGLDHQYWDGIWSGVPHKGHGLRMMNSWEKWRMGWLSFVDYDPSASLNGDGDTVTLCDLTTHPQAIRIKLPYTGITDEYLYLEHHNQSQSRYITSTQSPSDPWFDPLRIDPPTYDIVDEVSPTPGMFIIYDDGINYTSPPLARGETGDEGALRVLTADGRWNWISDGWVPAPWDQNQLLRVYKRGIPARSPWNTGLQNPDPDLHPQWNIHRTDRQRLEMDSLYVDNFGSSYRIYDNIWAWRNPDGTVTNDNRPKYKGDGCDAWTPTFNNILSPWSNPNTNTRLNAVTDIAVELIAQTDSTSTVRIYLSDPISGPPSKPLDLRASKSGGYYEDHHYWTLTWEPNLEPDVDSAGVYYIYVAVPSDTATWQLVDSVPGNVSTWSTIWIDDSENYLYHYRIQARDTSFRTSVYSEAVRAAHTGTPASKRRVEEKKLAAEASLSLLPNPAADDVTIRFALPEAGAVSLRNYDMKGREMKRLLEEFREEGEHTLTYKGEGLSAGRYRCLLLYRERAFSEELVLLR